ncbi:Fcr3 transcriptional regulator [Scheffersomyces amazonensis]|uniref:Fcr3 transcriptional regulator n=1 Tax=Scheffersomyces amazonensis TaxID=1078765 RepID=UPI00315DFBBB
MTYNNINTQQQVSGFWEPQGNNYDDLYPGLELNQENVTLFNNTQYQSAGHPQQHQQQQQYGSLFKDTDNSQTQYTVSPESNNLKYDSDSLNHNSVFDTHLAHDGNPHSSDDSSPLGKNQIPSPETSSSTGGIDVSNSKKSKSKRQLLDEQDAILIARDDSELTEEELQLKRKAQNRAAQRAFRERKETKLKELEAKLLQSEEERQQLMEQLDLIRKQNISIQTENEVLRSNKGSTTDYSKTETNGNKFSFPQTQSDFIEALVTDKHQIYPNSINKVYNNPEESSEKILAIGAVWDYLQIKAEEKDIDLHNLDINTIMNKLRGHEKCHGFGPAYSLELVQRVFEESYGG